MPHNGNSKETFYDGVHYVRRQLGHEYLDHACALSVVPAVKFISDTEALDTAFKRGVEILDNNLVTFQTVRYNFDGQALYRLMTGSDGFVPFTVDSAKLIVACGFYNYLFSGSRGERVIDLLQRSQPFVDDTGNVKMIQVADIFKNCHKSSNPTNAVDLGFVDALNKAGDQMQNVLAKRHDVYGEEHKTAIDLMFAKLTYFTEIIEHSFATPEALTLYRLAVAGTLLVDLVAKTSNSNQETCYVTSVAYKQYALSKTLDHTNWATEVKKISDCLFSSEFSNAIGAPDITANDLMKSVVTSSRVKLDEKGRVQKEDGRVVQSTWSANPAMYRAMFAAESRVFINAASKISSEKSKFNSRLDEIPEHVKSCFVADALGWRSMTSDERTLWYVIWNTSTESHPIAGDAVKIASKEQFMQTLLAGNDRLKKVIERASQIIRDHFEARTVDQWAGCLFGVTDLLQRKLVARVDRHVHSVNALNHAEVIWDKNNIVKIASKDAIAMNHNVFKVGEYVNNSSAIHSVPSKGNANKGTHGVVFIGEYDDILSDIRYLAARVRTIVDSVNQTLAFSYSYAYLTMMPPTDGKSVVEFGMDSNVRAKAGAYFDVEPFSMEEGKEDLESALFFCPRALLSGINEASSAADTSSYIEKLYVKRYENLQRAAQVEEGIKRLPAVDERVDLDPNILMFSNEAPQAHILKPYSEALLRPAYTSKLITNKSKSVVRGRALAKKYDLDFKVRRELINSATHNRLDRTKGVLAGTRDKDGQEIWSLTLNKDGTYTYHRSVNTHPDAGVMACASSAEYNKGTGLVYAAYKFNEPELNNGALLDGGRHYVFTDSGEICSLPDVITPEGMANDLKLNLTSFVDPVIAVMINYAVNLLVSKYWDTMGVCPGEGFFLESAFEKNIRDFVDHIQSVYSDDVPLSTLGLNSSLGTIKDLIEACEALIAETTHTKDEILTLCATAISGFSSTLAAGLKLGMESEYTPCCVDESDLSGDLSKMWCISENHALLQRPRVVGALHFVELNEMFTPRAAHFYEVVATRYLESYLLLR